jgi:hypothetical protein
MNKITQDDVDALYGQMCRQKKGSKAYWQALSDMHYLQAAKNLQDLEELRSVVKESDAGKALEMYEALKKENENLKAQLEDYDKDTNKQIEQAESEMRDAQEELTMLREAIGLSLIDWERAKDLGRLPTGQFLT